MRGIVFVLLALLLVFPAMANDCLQAGTILYEDDPQCQGDPDFDKWMQVDSLKWGDKEIALINTGNELRAYRVDLDPLSPQYAGASHFNVGHVGDTDYDCFSFSVCDDCRFSALRYRTATVIVDFGAGQLPTYTYFNKDRPRTPGVVVFTIADECYLLTSELGTSCPGPGIHRIRSIDDLDEVGCMDIPAQLLRMRDPPAFDAELVGGAGAVQATGEAVMGGKQVGSRLYVVTTYLRLLIYSIGPDATLTFLGPDVPITGFVGRGQSFDVEDDILVTTWVTGGTKIWDVSDPTSVLLVGTLAAGGNKLDLDWPWLAVTTEHSIGATWTADLTEPSSPVTFGAAYWESRKTAHACQRGYDILWVASDDGTARGLINVEYGYSEDTDATDCEPVATPTPTPTPTLITRISGCDFDEFVGLECTPTPTPSR